MFNRYSEGSHIASSFDRKLRINGIAHKKEEINGYVVQ